MSLFTEINSENKLRLSITYYSMCILREDQENFEIGMATLINRIIGNYYCEADASISIKLDQYRKQLEDALGSGEDAIIEKLLAAEEKVRKERLPRYTDASESFTFRINNENLFLLTEDSSTHEEKYYIKGLKAYLEALVEEFCRLQFVDREKIYFKDICDSLLQAQREEYAVYIQHRFGKKYLAKVYDITTDSLSTYSYVVTRLINGDNSRMNGRVFSFRLSRIKKVIPKPRVSGTFTEKELQSTARAISQNGVQFVSDRINNIVVRFTDEGLKGFASQMHLRPHYTKIHEDKHTYEFQCTYRQAFFYFQRLGDGVKILKPAKLAQEIKEWHLKAAGNYS